MNTITQTVMLSFLPYLLFSQAQISGIINDYAAVSAIELCEAKLTVSNSTGFEPGGKVLLVQMKGATINTANSGSFGNIDEIRGAGLYELNEVISKTGNEIYLRYEVLNNYEPNAGLQLITIPKYDDALIVSTLTAKPWDGETGGVLIFEADNLQISANIDVSGLGFRGADKKLVASDCTFWTNADEFHYNTTNWRGSPKGEGIAAMANGKEHGRGAQANGGGGGNDHNSGGGGGGNVSSGGIGGKQSTSGFGCDGDYPGRGGKACPTDAARIYLGGGGGAGHFDDDGAGSSGGNGGGVAIIIAKNIAANGYSIISNGMKPSLAYGDGAGGGGAAGTIVLAADDVQGVLNIEAKGGDGGDSGNISDRCNGVGGGGSGGRFIAKSFVGLSINLDGGQPGVNLVSSGQCNGPSNGAEQGEAGVSENFLSLPHLPHEIIATNVLQQPENPLGCVGVPLEIDFHIEGNYLTYVWQQNLGNGWENVPNNGLYDGETSPNLTITGPAPAMDGTKFRCVVTNPCYPELISNEVTLELVGAAVSDFLVDAVGNGSYQFQNISENATSYLWDFGDGTTSTEENPTHQYSDFGDYTVKLTAIGPCGEAVHSYNLLVAVAPTANFTFQNAGNCAPQFVQFENQSSNNSTSYQWYFPGGEPSYATSSSPLVAYPSQGLYDVMLIATNAVGNDTFTLTQAIEVGGTPLVDFQFDVNNLSVSFFNQSLNSLNGYTWDFGDGTTSDEPNPIHQYAAQGNFTVTLTGYNDCGETTVSMQVPTGSFPLAAFDADMVEGCSPLVVQFENQSTGSNINGFQWEFQGGQPATSNEPNPTVAYPLPGTYPVKLTVTNALGSHLAERLDFIRVIQSPVADFTYQIDGYTVTFSNASNGGEEFTWDFGDGMTSHSIDPSHTFLGPGIYDVMLTAMSSSCGSAISYPIFLEPLSTDEKGADNPIVVYPNPTSGLLNIGFGESEPIFDIIQLRNAAGVLLQSIKLAGQNSVSINAASLPAGVYSLEILSEGQHVSRRFVKL